jgi:hypothetical protein
MHLRNMSFIEQTAKKCCCFKLTSELFIIGIDCGIDDQSKAFLVIEPLDEFRWSYDPREANPADDSVDMPIRRRRHNLGAMLRGSKQFVLRKTASIGLEPFVRQNGSGAR